MGRFASFLRNIIHAPGRISVLFADAVEGRHPRHQDAEIRLSDALVRAETLLGNIMLAAPREERPPARHEPLRDGEFERLDAVPAGRDDTGLRVIHAPANIGNQPWTLSRNERALGLKSDLVVHWTAPSFRYPADKVLGTVGGASADEIFARVEAGLRAPLDYDVLHFYFGRTLFSWDDLPNPSPYPYLDLKIAKTLGRRVFFTLQGCDVRLAHRSNARNAVTMCREGACRFFGNCVSDLDARRQAFIEEALPLADKVFYLNPELGHYIPRAEFLPYSNVEIDDVEVIPPAMDGRIKIVHAPSDGAIKGTAAILAALREIEGRYDFELILIEGLPHEEAMRLYRSADIVIDQILAGWYGGFAVEVMAMGKPVLCYLREEDFSNVPAAMIAELPIRNIRQEYLAEDIADALDHRAEWAEWSSKSRRFVEKWHNPGTIAKAMVAAYADPTKPIDIGALRDI